MRGQTKFGSGPTSAQGSRGTPGRRPVIPSSVVRFTAAWAMILCLIWFGTSEAAQDPLVNCNEVILEDRCACNERVLRALTQSRPMFLDPTEGGNPGEADAAISIQQARQHRLRTFYAPACKGWSSSELLPVAEQHTGGWLDRETIESHLKPLGAKTIDVHPRDGVEYIGPDILLPGRWEGWQTLFGGKPSPVSFHVILVDGKGPFVKACSDQGMVFARVKDGYLELPRSDSFGLAYSIRLWRSRAPHSQDLEGIVLLEVRPGKVLVAGLVWLSRAVKLDWSTPPSSYFCQDRDLEERKKIFREAQERKREEEGTLPLIQLEKRVQQLRRELEAVRIELEAARPRSFIGDVNRQGPNVDAK